MTQIKQGDMRIRVQGEEYREGKLERIKLNTPTQFSLTPPNSYQKEQGWPDGDFINVNTYPSSETTYNNWFGYIRYKGKPSIEPIARLVIRGQRVSVWGIVEKGDKHREIILLVPKQKWVESEQDSSSFTDVERAEWLKDRTSSSTSNETPGCGKILLMFATLIVLLIIVIFVFIS